jgi:predicted DCC family thiol-disulfide oxidoreductase YuxK
VTGGRPPAGLPAPADTWTLIYDGECAFCRWCVGLVARWDAHARVRPVAFQDRAALDGLPPIPQSALEAAMHLVSPSGEVRAGAAAMPAVLRLLPAVAPMALLFRVPGVPGLAAWTYAAVARNRHRLGCGSSVCRRGR